VSESVTVRFIPQAWVSDWAVEVDPAGPTTFQVPAADAKDPQGSWLVDRADASDVLQQHPNAPSWVRAWSGPFEVEIEHEHPIGARPDRHARAGTVVLTRDDIDDLAAGHSINVPAGPRDQEIVLHAEDFDGAIAALRAGMTVDAGGYRFQGE
jgi:hypothetical protein